MYVDHMSNLRQLSILFSQQMQGRKLTFLGRCQLSTELFFQSPNGKMWATSCEILVASAKFLVALATRKGQFPTLKCAICFFSPLCVCESVVSIFFCFCQVTCMQTLKKVRKHTTTLPCKETSFVFRATLNLERSAVANLREQMTQGPLDDKVDIVINVKQLLCKTRYSCCKTLLLYIVNCSQHCVTGETV